MHEMYNIKDARFCKGARSVSPPPPGGGKERL